MPSSHVLLWQAGWRTRIAAALLLALAAVSPAAAQPAARWDAMHGAVLRGYESGTPRAALIAPAREALAFAQRAFGPRSQHALFSLNTLGLILYDAGELVEAEAVQRQALDIARATVGPRDYRRVDLMMALAETVAATGRAGEAARLRQQVYEARRATLGPNHLDTAAAMNDFAVSLGTQRRDTEAEPLLREAVRLRRAALGPRAPLTLVSLHNLGSLLARTGREGEAEATFREVIAGGRTARGGDGQTAVLASLSGLSNMLRGTERAGEAEATLREGLAIARRSYGAGAALTIHFTANLAATLGEAGRLKEAVPMLREALRAARGAPTMGPTHPSTLTYATTLVGMLAATGRIEEATEIHAEAEPTVLAWLAEELRQTEGAAARRNTLRSRAQFQDVALSLALLPGAPPGTAERAAATVLRFKGLAAEEEMRLARLVRRGENPRLRALAAEVTELRARLAGTLGAVAEERPEARSSRDLTAQLDLRERELATASRAYAEGLAVRSARLDDLRRMLRGLPVRGALLEIREYRPVDFAAGGTTPVATARLAGILLDAEGRVTVRDLGSSAAIAAASRATLGDDAPAADAAAEALHAAVIAPFAAELTGVERLYLAPDGPLLLVNPGLLRDPDGQRLFETMDLRLLQTGRDLLRPLPERPARGLVAFGDISYDAAPATARTPARNATAATRPPTEAPGEAELRQRTAAALGAGFEPLPATRAEVEAIARLWRAARRDEPVAVVGGAEATEARLLANPPPRVLHLATHGFFLASREPSERPLLLAGIALAGANRELRGTAREGILYAIEAQGLNLEGTDLVVLSACETGQGQVDAADGLSGLVRALRTAGARHVLVSLRDVSDAGTAAFMTRFYAHLLAGGGTDPAAALRATQRELNGTWGAADPSWARFILIGG